MSWQRQTLVFQLNSGLYIGTTSLGFIQRTRWFVPAKNLWAMTTRVVTEWLRAQRSASQQNSARLYRKVGAAVDTHIKFTNFYLWTARGGWYTPKFDLAQGLLWGDTTPAQFAHRFIATYTSTALEMSSSAAQENTLHELEYLRHRDAGQNVYLVGEMFFRHNAAVLEHQQKHISVSTLLNEILPQAYLYLGGESAYGYGHIQYQPNHVAQRESFKDLTIESTPDDGPLRCQLRSGAVLPCFAKVEHSPNVTFEGDIELMVTREWDKRGPGRKIVSDVGYCWQPGTHVKAKTDTIVFTVGRYGMWYREPNT